MNQSLAPPIRKANPGTFQSDHEVIRQFVVRSRELDIVLEILRENAKTSSCQHVLLVAPRGRGKTMLLARVAAELRVQHDLSRHLLPVRFMEESHEIFDMADFWLECLFHLSRESAVRDPALSRELRDTHGALSARGRQDELIEPRARSAVLETADRLGKKLVLMVENLQDLSGDVDERFGWKLREELQSQPRIMLLATATSHFQALDEATQPFFELFRILGLDPLDTEECRRLWHVLSGDAVRAREIRPLQILTGGNPRLLVFVADFARHRSVRQLMEQLVKLVDDHTEYFRSHLEGFAKTERRVYLATVDLWQPSTAGEITARARLDVRTVSTMLGRLVQRGALIAEGDAKKRRYAASERLYTIYYKLRRERDEAAVVCNLIRFMTMFYSDPELAGMSDKMSLEAAQSTAIREGIERTIAEALQSDEVISAEKLSIIEQVRNQAMKSIVMERAKSLYTGVTTAVADGKCEQVVMLVDRFLTSRDDKPLRSSTTFVDVMISTKLLAQAEIGGDASAVASYEEVVERFSTSDVPAVEAAVAMALFNRGIAQNRLGDPHAAIASYSELVNRYGARNSLALQDKVAKSLINKGTAQSLLDNHHEAIATLREVVCRYSASDSLALRVHVAMAFWNIAVVHGQLGNAHERRAAYDEIAKRYGNSDSPELEAQVAKALVAKGVTQAQIGDTAGGIAAYDEVVRRHAASESPELRTYVAAAMVNKGFIQIIQDHLEDALRTCDMLEGYGSLADPADVTFGWWTVCLRAKALIRLGRQAEAMESFRSTYSEFRATHATIRELLKLALELIASGVPERDLLEIVARDRDKAAALAPLGVALRIRTGEEVRAPAEVMEVAQDVLKQLSAEH